MIKRSIIALTVSLVTISSCMRHEHVDVFIAGGGAGGVSAGIQSARMGASTLIVEQTPWLGGMLTSAGVSCIDGNYNLRSGIFGEFADSLASVYGGWEALKTGWVSNINFEPHVGQDILTGMAEGCGDRLEVMRETEILSVSGSEGNWTIVVRDAAGHGKTIHADVVIDATELGDVAKACGISYRVGMEAASLTGESIAPQESNDIIQDLTYVAVLKDYGKDADMIIDMPEGYDAMDFANCAVNSLSTELETGQTLWPVGMMITYGALPNGKYMINWPICGNDYYVNTIDMSPEERSQAYEKAKNFTLCMVYFIQTHLGMKHLGIADDEFPTEDGMPFFPYHRESRRICGEVFFTMDNAARPYDSNLYRTGIAVGDYAVDHHHFRHPDWKSLPDLHFYPIPSFSVPLGVLVPKEKDGLIVAEKSVSVSNLINGATRLQPVVMQLGQAAGAMAALSCIHEVKVKDVPVRQIQAALLDAGCYLMPYLDLPKDHPHFAALQKVGATGILRGEGRNEGWTNQTWFRAGDILMVEDMYMEDYYPDWQKDGLKGSVTCSVLKDMVLSCGACISFDDPAEWWASLGLSGWNPDRPVTRLEAAVVLDASLDPFTDLDVDYQGNISCLSRKR